MYLIYVLQVLMSPKFQSFHSMTTHFGVTGYFDTSAPNDPQIALATTRSKVPHICVTIVPGPRISVRFALRPVILDLQAILKKKCTEWPPNDIEHYKIVTPYNVLPVSQSPRCHPISLYDQPFRVTGHVDTTALNDPKITLNTTRRRVAHIFYHCHWISNFSPFCSTTSHFTAGHFETVYRLTPNDLDPYKVKDTPYVCY